MTARTLLGNIAWVLFALAEVVGLVVVTARAFADLSLTDSAPGYSLVTTLFMLGVSVYAFRWALKP